MDNGNEKIWLDKLSAGIDKHRDENVKKIDNWYRAGVAEMRSIIRMHGKRTASDSIIRLYREMPDADRDYYLSPHIKAAYCGIPAAWDMLLTIAHSEAVLKGDLKKWIMAVADGKLTRNDPNRGRPKKDAIPRRDLEYCFNDDYMLIHTVIYGIINLTEDYKLTNTRNANKQGDKHSAADAVVEAYLLEGIPIQTDIKNGKRQSLSETDRAFNRVKNIWNARKTKHGRIYQAILDARKTSDRNVLRIK